MNFESWKAIQVANRNIKEAENIINTETVEIVEVTEVPTSTETIEEAKIDEGRMKDIDLLSQEATSKEDFAKKMKDYLKEIGKPELATDEFIKSFVDDWKPKEEKEQD